MNDVGHNYKSFVEPQIYNKKFKKYFYHIEQTLDKMKKSFADYKLNGDLTYPKNLDKLSKLSADLMQTESDLNKNASELKINVDIINFFIKEVEIKINILKEKIDKIKSSKLASQGELNIQNIYYYEILIQNFILFLLIILYIGLFIKFR